MAKFKKKTKEERSKCTMRTPTFTLSYPHLDKPYAMKASDKEKYSVQALFPKDENMLGWTIPDTKGGKTLRRKLKSIVNNALVAEFGANESDWPEEIEKPIRDGDGKKLRKKEGCPGNYVVNFQSHAESRPQLFDERMNLIEDPAEIKRIFYGGCKCQAIVYAFVWFYPDRNSPAKIGVSISVDSIQKQEDGKKFSSRKDGAEIFAPLDTGDDEDSDDDDSDDDQKDFY